MPRIRPPELLDSFTHDVPFDRQEFLSKPVNLGPELFLNLEVGRAHLKRFGLRVPENTVDFLSHFEVGQVAGGRALLGEPGPE